MSTQKITPFLWFNDNAEAAINFYASVFKDSKIGHISRYGEGSRGPAGSLMTASFELNGQQFIALNGGPMFRFTEAVSFMVSCATQEEVDDCWQKLTENGGQESQCGWLKDKFGLSWQIVPAEMGAVLQDKDPARAARAMAAMLKMKKIDLNALKAAKDGE